ncbi:MAG: signal recognition particle-docking protein FtsY, partial [Halothiobacillus sp.]
MFGFLRRKKAPETPAELMMEPEVTQAAGPEAAPAAETVATPTSPAPVDTEQSAALAPLIHAEIRSTDRVAPLTEPANREKPKSRFWQQLSRTRSSVTEGLGDLFLGKKAIDDELLEEIETRLLLADIGQTTTQALIKELQQLISRKQLNDAEALFEKLGNLMVERLQRAQKPRPTFTELPHIIVVCGINGAGKTTTIGKLAYYFKNQGHKVMLAAGDTFRAAAVEQLMTWGERNQIPVIGEPGRNDAASVLFDAAQSAKARQIDVLIADTAGRLHTQGGLMDELKKLVRVLSKSQPGAPHEILLVLDASIGQNALNQARLFHQAVGVTGLVVTKLDGTAKGGVLFAIADELGLPIDFIGVGEQLEDLRPFE